MAASIGLSACTNAPSGDIKPEAATMSLAGSEWSPEDLMNDTDPPFIQFGSEGRVSGYTGCNQLSGSYTQINSALSFGPLAVTKKMCPDNMGNETLLLQALSDTELANISHLKLDLIDGDNEILMTFLRRDPD